MNLIRVDYRMREKFWNWCNHHGCKPEHQGCEAAAEVDVWYIPSERVYLLAVMRWS